MRLTLAFLTVATLALALPATAQDPGCLEAKPCELDVDVDALGLDLGQDTFTAGDWVRLSVYNDDDVPHTITLFGHDVTLVVPAYDIVESAPFEMDRAGTYALRDSPSGDSANVVVDGAATFDDGSGDDSNGIPALGPALLVTGLAVALAVARRR